MTKDAKKRTSRAEVEEPLRQSTGSGGPPLDAHRVTYAYRNASSPHPWLDEYALRAALTVSPRPVDILDLGCGNGAGTRLFVEAGFRVVGCDPEATAVRIAQREVPDAHFVHLGVYDDASEFGPARFDLVVATEVVEHLFLPRALPRFARAVLRPGGHLVLTTPHYGHYLRNLLLSVLDRWDHQFSPLWDGGHVKFWSPRTMSDLLEEAGFRVLQIEGVNSRGRVFNPIWPNNMVVLAKMGGAAQ